jgi:hypothetical protein
LDDPPVLVVTQEVAALDVFGVDTSAKHERVVTTVL